MAKLAPMLDRLARHDDAAARAGESPARLVLASGKRSRVEGDGDFETISAAALGEDDVRDLLLQTGVGSRLDALGTRPLEWTFRHEGATYRSEAVIQGRELRATIVRVRAEAADPVRSATEAKAPARGATAAKAPPRATEARAPARGATEEVRARGYDPRSDEEPPRSRSPAPAHEGSTSADGPSTREGRVTVQADEVARALAAELTARHTPEPPPPASAVPAPVAPASGPASDVDAWRDVVASAVRGGSPFGASFVDRVAPDALDDVHDRPTLEPRLPVSAPIELDDVADRIASRRASLPPVFGFDEPPPVLPAEGSSRPRTSAPVSDRPRLRTSLPAMDLPTSTPPPASEHPVVGERLRRLIDQARRAGASDLHLAEGRPAVARIGGAMAPAGEPIDGRVLERLLLPTMSAGHRAALERDGSVTFALPAGEGAAAPRCRLSISHQRTGLKASIRLLHGTLPTVADLELPEPLVQATRHPHGLILIGGPAGHGKSTTVAALVDHLNATTTRHILTIEGPIEYLHPRKKALLSQREVGRHARTVDAAMHGALRQDVDVIVLGSLHDVASARAAIAASEDGQLVLATLDTRGAARAIERLIDLFPATEQPRVRSVLATDLRLATSQRLVSRREGAGRVAAVEVIPASPALAALLRDARTYQIPALVQRGGVTGAVRMDDALADLVRRGVIDRKEAMSAADDPQQLGALLDGRPPEGPTDDGAPAGPAKPPAVPARPPTETGEERGPGRALWQRAADMFRRGGG